MLADATATKSYLAAIKSRLVLPFWCRLTQVVLENRPLNGCLSSRFHAVDQTASLHCDRTQPHVKYIAYLIVCDCFSRARNRPLPGVLCRLSRGHVRCRVLEVLPLRARRSLRPSNRCVPVYARLGRLHVPARLPRPPLRTQLFAALCLHEPRPLRSRDRKLSLRARVHRISLPHSSVNRILVSFIFLSLRYRGATTFSKLGVQFLGLGYCTEQNTDGIPSFVHCRLLRNGNHTLHQKS